MDPARLLSTRLQHSLNRSLCVAIFPHKTTTSVCLGFFLHTSSMVFSLRCCHQQEELSLLYIVKKKLSSDTNHKRKRGSGSELKHPGSSTLIVWNYSDYYGFWLLIHKVSCDRAGMANECGYTRACILVELTISYRNHFAVNQKCQFSPSLAPEPETRIHQGRMHGKIRKIFFMICSTV